MREEKGIAILAKCALVWKDVAKVSVATGATKLATLGLLTYNNKIEPNHVQMVLL